MHAVGISPSRRIYAPIKGRPLPPLEAIEDATWMKGLSPRKTSSAQSGFAPRMVAASMSAARDNSGRSSAKGSQLTAEDAGPPVFVGRGMKIYVDGEEDEEQDFDVEETGTLGAARIKP